MSSALQGALSELRRAGATGLPDAGLVEKAANGTSWSGKKSNGDPWGLTKNNQDSYNSMC